MDTNTEVQTRVKNNIYLLNDAISHLKSTIFQMRQVVYLIDSQYILNCSNTLRQLVVEKKLQEIKLDGVEKGTYVEAF